MYFLVYFIFCVNIIIEKKQTNCETMFSFNAINTALKNSILLVARFMDLPQPQLSEKNDLRLRFMFARWLKK